MRDTWGRLEASWIRAKSRTAEEKYIGNDGLFEFGVSCQVHELPHVGRPSGTSRASAFCRTPWIQFGSVKAQALPTTPPACAPTTGN